ncbi:hypothetical protein [Virgibacillus senegalensis]|uniref:hypothetical protein n=1 Tax=Virgibacillus senegalensis TaxID=1499679 RepID=UPI000AA3C9F6|nr:hypothetical protein [Virgibacillus senegalensis]
MLGNLAEEDFFVLRGPFESGRQSPRNLGAMLILSIPFHILMFFLAYVAAADSSAFPYITTLLWAHLVISSKVILFSIIFAIPSIYIQNQKLQYLIVILISQNIFGILPYFMAVFYIGKEFYIPIESLMNFTYITFSIGILVFFVTGIRFFVLLRKGEYRVGTKKEEIRTKMEFKVKSYLPIIITGSLGAFFTFQYLIRLLGIGDIYNIMMLTLCVLLFYAMLFVLPEQLVILYCKYRFDSFNFNKEDKLKPVSRKEGLK